MGALLQLILCFYILTLCFSAFAAVPRFFIDVGKWHSPVKKEKIISSKERKEVEELERRRNECTGGGNNSDRDTDGSSDGDGDGNNDNNDNNKREPLKF